MITGLAIRRTDTQLLDEEKDVEEKEEKNA